MPGAPREQGGLDPSTTQAGRVIAPPDGTPLSMEAPPPPLTEAGDGEPDDSSTQDGEVFRLRSQDFRKIKDKARDKGKREALAEIAGKFQAAGFADLDEAAKLLARLKNSQTPPTERRTQPTMPETKTAKPSQKNQPSKNGQPKRTLSREERQLANERNKFVEEKEKLTRKWRQEERRRRDLQRQLDAKEAEMQLREVAIQTGVKDVDYAIRLLTRELKGKKEEELAAFDEAAFFKGLRNDRPYLFGEYQAPATTGNAAEEPPPQPEAGDVTTAAAGDGQFDARSASREDYEKRLRQLGLNSHI